MAAPGDDGYESHARDETADAAFEVLLAAGAAWHSAAARPAPQGRIVLPRTGRREEEVVLTEIEAAVTQYRATHPEFGVPMYGDN